MPFFNSLLAERYVTGFYESVLPALELRQSDSARKLIEALQAQPMLVSGFEAALVIRFLDPQAILDLERRSGKLIT